MNQDTLLSKIENSFKLAIKGKERLDVLMWYWGVPMYIMAHFVVDRAVLRIDSRVFDVAASMSMIIYFIGHIFVLKKCSPKKVPLSAEEKQRLKVEARQDRAKRMMRKLLLQEPFTKWNPVFVCIVLDLYFIASFMFYI